jgi:hypothetical protein
MTGLQKNVVSTWFISSAAITAALYTYSDSDYRWIVILIASQAFCGYLKRNCPEDNSLLLDVISTKGKILILIYYLAFGAIIFYIVILTPELVTYDKSQLLIFMFAFFLPTMPAWVRHEANCYKSAGNI